MNTDETRMVRQQNPATRDFAEPFSNGAHPLFYDAATGGELFVSEEVDLQYSDLTRNIIGAAFTVHRELGYGFLERVYRNSMLVELEKRGLEARVEHPIKVFYQGIIVGDYFADLLVEDRVVVELKIAKHYNEDDEAQVLNELKATGVKVGLLINFGRVRVEFKRLVF